MAGTLQGLKIIEFASIGPGPFCAMMLADHGADVVTIDRAGSNVTGEMPIEIMRRSRRSIALDLKNPSDVEIALRMVEQSDALLEGFRPGVMERLGLGPEVCMRRNAALVYGRVTGWGQTGPLASQPGHDINYIAITGAVDAFGRPDSKPSFPANLLGDYASGAMFLGFGMLCGLLEAKRSGKGQVIDAAMVDGAVVLMTLLHELRANGEWRDERGTNVLDGGAPYYEVYETSDSKYVSIGAVEPQFYDKLLRVLGLHDSPDMMLQNCREKWPAQKQILETMFRSRTRDEWTCLLEQEGVCFAPVLSMSEAVDHPHNQARGNFLRIHGLDQAAPAPRFSRSNGAIPSPPRPRGADRAELLAEFGIDI